MAYAWKPLSDGCRIYFHFGCTRATDEALTQDGVETDTWWTDFTPVSTKNIRLVGTIGADTEFIVNFDLEPLTGRITIDDTLPEYDSISASYYHLTDIEGDIMTVGYKVFFPRPISEADMFGQPHYQIHNNYPEKVTGRLVLETDTSRNLLTEATFYACYFIMKDTGTGATFGVRAFEGPIWSDEQGSLQKGASYLMPFELSVQQFGLVKELTTGAITSAANPGGGETTLAVANHDLTTGQWVVVTGTANYNGTWLVTVLDDHNFNITIAFVANNTGTMTRPEQITWGFWEN